MKTSKQTFVKTNAARIKTQAATQPVSAPDTSNRAVNVKVLESEAEEYEGVATKPRTVSVSHADGTAVSGFTMSHADWQRLDNAAANWSEAKNDSRRCIPGFIEDAIKEKLDAAEAAFGKPPVAVPMADAKASGAKVETRGPATEEPADRESGLPLALLDSLSILQMRVNEAGALALLNADVIKTSTNDYDGWQAFDHDYDKFNDGVNGLAYYCVARLNRSLNEYEAAAKQATKLGPVRAAKTWRHVFENGMDESGSSVVHQIDKGVDALCALLDTQSLVMSQRNHDKVFALVEFATAGLEAAFDVFYDAAWKFWRALVGDPVESEQAAERRAA